MVGLGEEKDEIFELMRHAFEAGVDIFTVGQYLRPSMKHAEIKKYYHPRRIPRVRRDRPQHWPSLGVLRSSRPQFLPCRRRLRPDDVATLAAYEKTSTLDWW